MADAPGDKKNDITRAQFLTKATIGIGGLMGAMIAVPVAGMALAPAVKSRTFTSVFLGYVDEFSEGKFIKAVLDPGRGTPDGYVRKRVAYIRKNAKGYNDTFAPNTPDGRSQNEFTVISNRCAHLGCPVEESGGTFVCPCHGGAYDTNGDRTAGPPVRPLDRYEWEVRPGKKGDDKDELWATDEYSVTSSGKRVSVRGPGQHVDGIEGLLYPLTP